SSRMSRASLWLAIFLLAPAAYAVDTAGMDRAVAPGDDFFGFANGTWLKTTEIPSDRSGWGNFAELNEKTLKQTKQLLEAAAPAPAGPVEKKAGDFYASFIDEAGIEKKGVAPLQPGLARIAAIKDKRGLAEVLGGDLRNDVDALNNTNFHTDRL